MRRIINLLIKFPLLKNISADSMYKFVWYAIIGAITFIIVNVCLYIFRRSLVWADVPSIALSYVIAVICHFLLNNRITFKMSNESFRHRLGGHIIISVINYFIGVGITAAVIKIIIDSNIIATGCSTAVTMLLGYTMLNRFVYKTYKTTQEGKTDDNNQKSA